MTQRLKAAAHKKRDSIQGEGDYEAARHYDEKLGRFVAEKKGEVPKLAQDAKDALAGPGGAELRKAEEIGKSKARH